MTNVLLSAVLVSVPITGELVRVLFFGGDL